jgi:hypothetical protein
VDGREYVAVQIRGKYMAFALPTDSNSPGVSGR